MAYINEARGGPPQDQGLERSPNHSRKIPTTIETYPIWRPPRWPKALDYFMVLSIVIVSVDVG